MEIAILLHDEMTALDVVGPYEVLARMPGAQVRFVAAQPGPVRADAGLGLHADYGFADVPRPDLLLLPGSSNPAIPLGDPATLQWVRDAHAHATWTTSVCSGSLILAAAGVLTGRRATSHWIALDALRALGAEPVSERIVVDGSIVTAAGVSAGIDLALRLAAIIHGDDVARALQLAIEYDPQPPFAISAYTAPESLRAAAAALIGGAVPASCRRRPPGELTGGPPIGVVRRVTPRRWARSAARAAPAPPACARRPG